MIVSSLLASLAWAQAYEESPCRAVPALRDELTAGEVSSVAPVGPDRGLVVASSVLAAPGAKKPVATPDQDPEDALRAHDAWTCTYGPTNLIDGDPTTAWVEGAEGGGTGEAVLVALPGAGPLEIRAGYAKSATLHRQNARPKEVEVLLLGPGRIPATQDILHLGLPVLGRHVVTLTDADAWQPLPLPAWSAPTRPLTAPDPTTAVPAQEPAFVALRIVSVYPGEKWQDTCISELRAAR